ncbi:hypothetical protein R3P38DRAFT_2773677 [Favolaschia claudopus]|uniref:Uncharacterized protein n=1 Tax=Favolaschia claudopus TaxID=2862362 RepID=A0AAW0C318_9AGAR
MAETTLQSRISYSGVSEGPKKTWKKTKKPSYNSTDHHRASWPPGITNFYEQQEEPQPNAPSSLIGRIGPKVSPATSRPSLLQRMNVDDATDAAAVAAHASGIDNKTIPANGVAAANSTRNEVLKNGGDSSGENGRSSNKTVFTKPSWNGFYDNGSDVRHDVEEQSTEDLANGIPPAETLASTLKPPQTQEVDRFLDSIVNSIEAGPSTPASDTLKRPPLSVSERLARSLRSAVFQNARLRGATDLPQVQRKIDVVVTDRVCEAFSAQMKQVKVEMDAPRAEEAMQRAKDQLLDGFRKPNAIEDEVSHKPLPPETASKPPPTAPRAMIHGIQQLPPRMSLKGKERAIDLTGDNDLYRTNGQGYDPSLRASPMQTSTAVLGPTKSAARRKSSSLSHSSNLTSHQRGFADELPRYRSPPHPPRDSKLHSVHSRSRSPARAEDTPRPRSRSPASGYAPRNRTWSFSFNSRRMSRSRSPAPPPYSNGRPRSRSIPRNHSRGRRASPPSATQFPPPDRLNSRYPPYGSEKTARSRSRSRGRRGGSLVPRQSRSPNSTTRKRKLDRVSPPYSPQRQRHRSASYDQRRSELDTPGYRRHSRFGLPNGNGNGEAFESPHNHIQGFLNSPFSFAPPVSNRVIREPSPPPPKSNNNLPGLWFVKVGAPDIKIVEGTFNIDPEFAVKWGIQSQSVPSSTRQKPQLSILLLCLPTEDLDHLYTSLKPSDPSAEELSTAVATLKTSWPKNGTLFVDINDEKTGVGKSWFPYDLDPTSPLDITHHVQPGQNVVRFIQLASLVERTFILYATHREPPVVRRPHEVPQMFDKTLSVPRDHLLFDFDSATVTVDPYVS